MEKTRATLVGVAVGLAALVLAPPAAAATRNATPEGVTYSYATGPDGQIVLQAQAGDLQLEKSVFADGRTTLVLRSPDGELRLEASETALVVEGGGGKYHFGPDAGDHRDAVAVRVALVRSGAVQLLRNLRFQIEERGPASAFDHAVLLSGALVSELLGETGSIRRLARRQRGTQPARIRKAAFGGQFDDCWTEYERSIMRAYDQYLYCLAERSIASFKWFNISYCDVRYAMQAESAWFQFLSCSSFRIL